MNVPRTILRGLCRVSAVFSFLFLASFCLIQAQTWTSSDVGAVGAAGTDSYNSTTGVYTLNGGEGNIAGTADACHFVYQTLSGDGELQARVASISYSTYYANVYYAKAGVMLRQSTAAGAIESSMLETYNNGTETTNRTTLNGTTAAAVTASVRAPYWVKVVKTGNLISSYQSADGVTWIFEGVASYALSGSVEIGLAIASDNGSLPITATFDNITLTPQASFSPSSPWSDGDIGSPSLAGGIHLEQPLWSIYGGGAGFSGTSDQFHFGYQSLTGNSVAVAQVSSLSAGTASAGVVMRQDLTAGSAEAAVLLNSTNGISFVTRTSAGATLTTTAGASSGMTWVELVRTGSTFYGYESSNGTSWTLIGSQTITMTDPIYVGVAGTSGNNSSTSLALEALNQVGVWMGTDVGTVGSAVGTNSYNGATGVYTMTSDSGDIGSTADACHFVYQTLSGDGELQARVASISYSTYYANVYYAKAGVMIRQSTSGGSIESSALETYDIGTETTSRTTAGGSTTSAIISSTQRAPYWVRIVKDGAQLCSYQSPDGVNWTFEGAVTCSIADPVEIGFAVASDSSTKSITATFDNIQMTQGFLDTDNNGLPDWWEIEYFGGTGATTGYNSTSDPDGSGFTLLQDYEGGATPTNYYSRPGTGGPITITPTETITGGNNQNSAPSTFAILPLVVQVTNSSGGAAESNAPVTFSVTSGGGLVSATNGGTTSTSVTITTNSGGQAQVYYQEPSGYNLTSAIQATTGGQSVNFASVSAGPPNSGLSLWLKADAGITQASGVVSSWSDQVGNIAFTQSGSASPTYVSSDVNGKPGLHFSGSQWVYNSGSLGTGVNADMTIITMAMSTTPSTEQYSAWLGSNPNTCRGLGYYTSSQDFNFSTTYLQGAAIPLANTFVMEAGSINSALNTVTFYRNGVQTTTTGGASGEGAVSSGMTMGAALDGTRPCWHGDIAEVLVYNHQLSPTEISMVDGYLADRYGYYSVNSRWPLNYSAAVQVEITKHQWSKVQADAYLAFQAANSTMMTNGLSLWFKADDTSAIVPAGGGTVSNGNSVSSWKDETGNYTVSQSNSSDQPTYVSSDLNGKPGLHFSGSQWLSYSGLPDSGLNADITIISVGATTNATSTLNFSLYLGQCASTGFNRAIGYDFGSETFDTYIQYCSGIAKPTPGTFVAEVATVDPSLSYVNFYQNGTATGPVSLSGAQPLSSNVTVGGDGIGSYGWQGDIVEQLVYDHKLSPSELQQVSLYLANKYGLAYNAPLVITPAGGSYTSSQTVSMSTSISSGVIHYTVDGTQPTASSLTYSSSITVSASALVQAIVTVSGTIASPLAGAQYYINDSGKTGLPITPTSLTASSISSTETDLAWVLTGMIDYSEIDVYRSTNGGAYVLIDVLPSTATSYADLTVVSGNSYTYEVGTLNQSGTSDTAASSAVAPPGNTTLNIIVTNPTGAVLLP